MASSSLPLRSMSGAEIDPTRLDFAKPTFPFREEEKAHAPRHLAGQRPRGMRGMARRKAQILLARIRRCAVRRPARQSRRLRHQAPLSERALIRASSQRAPRGGS
jgi:hypothetical protein